MSVTYIIYIYIYYIYIYIYMYMSSYNSCIIYCLYLIAVMLAMHLPPSKFGLHLNHSQ